MVGGQGGEVGPALDDIGAKVDRDYLLESIVNPNATIAKGYDFSNHAEKRTGLRRHHKERDRQGRVINSPEDGIVTVKTAEIKERIQGPSGMPPACNWSRQKTNYATS